MQSESSSQKEFSSPKSTSFMKTFHVGLMLCIFAIYFMLSTNKNKNSFPTIYEQTFHSKLFPNSVPMKLSQITVPTIVVPKDDRTNFFQEEQLGLPHWAMILATCVSVDVSKYLVILTLGIFNEKGSSFIFTRV